MGLRKVGLLLKDDHRLTKDVDLWGMVLPEAIREVYGRDMDFTEICEELHVAPWDYDYFPTFERVSDFANFLLN